jgi:4,5-DOPA dioxygenase extradiol
MSSLPTAFLSHGLPRLALEGGVCGDALRAWAAELNPRAVLVASSHWRTEVPTFTGARRPGIVHDYLGEALALYTLDYPAPGHPALALNAISLLADADVKGEIDPRRPLDSGAWIPLRNLFPKADVPVVEMSLPAQWRPEQIARLGLALAPLREDGVLIIGSGCMVHNPQRREDGDPAPWAVAFDRWLEERLRMGEMAASFGWERHPEAAQAMPCPNELAPLFFAWGAADGGAARSLCEGWQEGNVSLRSVTFAA